MDNNKVYQKIKDLAHQLAHQGAVYTRADLAYDLQGLGVSEDSYEVDKLVWEAYEYFNDDDAIRTSFYDNEGKDLLVDRYRVDHLLEVGDNASLFPLLHDKLRTSGGTLSRLDGILSETMGDSVINVTNIINVIKGTQGVVKIKEEASTMFNLYSEMVGGYDDAKHQVKSLITDFVKVRESVCDIYRRYALVLTDAFGDSIKAISPELFDFDSIEWLDVHGMLQNLKLDYEKISEKCSTLMSSISDSFGQSLNLASRSYRAAGNKQMGLVLAGLNMLTHYVGAAQATAELKQDLVALSNSVKHDVTLIKGDAGRLAVIYKTLNDLYIPLAEAFARYTGQVLSDEWQHLTEALYGSAEIQALKQSRDDVLEECTEIERAMNDNQMNIDYYSIRIDDCRQLLEMKKAQYAQAKAAKPQKPLLCFGPAKQKYNREVYEWDQACAPVISKYEDLQTDVKLDSEELDKQMSQLKENKIEYQRARKKLLDVNRRIMSKISVSDELKLRMLPHLESMIRLLRIAREIAGLKLDGRLTNVVSIKRQDTELPQDLKQNIASFAKSLKDNVKISEGMARDSYYAVADEYPDDRRPAPADFRQLTDVENNAVQSAVSLLESWAYLKTMQEQSTMAHKAYDKELKKLQQEFRRAIAGIDDKGTVLRECLKNINSSMNSEQLKDGLLSLAGKSGANISRKDWDDFLNGRKSIEL